MDFYRLKQTGAEWLTRQGDAIKAARAAKVGWDKIEVPTHKKEDMQAWLNTHARGDSDQPVEVDQGVDEERFWEKGPKTKDPPRIPTTFLRDHNAGVEFVPITRSASIAASYGGCPKCQRTWFAQVMMGLTDQKPEDLERLRDMINQRLDDPEDFS